MWSIDCKVFGVWRRRKLDCHGPSWCLAVNGMKLTFPDLLEKRQVYHDDTTTTTERQ